MDAKKLDHFTKRILEERDRIMGGLSNLAQDYQGASDAKSAEFEEAARIDRDREYLSSLISFDIEEMSEINDALKRVLEGTYGICLDCGKEIPDARLEARPTTPRCVECQKRAELEIRF